MSVEIMMGRWVTDPTRPPGSGAITSDDKYVVFEAVGPALATNAQLSAEWQQLSVEVPAEEHRPAAGFVLRLSSGAASTGGSVWIDDVVITNTTEDVPPAPAPR
jgi:hypothetical protein